MLLGIRALVWLVYAYLLITEVVLTLGFVLLLFGANPDASFVAWVYRSLDRAMEPFRGMFTPIDLGLSGSHDVGAVLDTSVLFAMLVYAFGAWVVHAALEWLGRLITRDERAAATQVYAPAPLPPGAGGPGGAAGAGPSYPGRPSYGPAAPPPPGTAPPR